MLVSLTSAIVIWHCVLPFNAFLGIVFYQFISFHIKIYYLEESHPLILCHIHLNQQVDLATILPKTLLFAWIHRRLHINGYLVLNKMDLGLQITELIEWTPIIIIIIIFFFFATDGRVAVCERFSCCFATDVFIWRLVSLVYSCDDLAYRSQWPPFSLILYCPMGKNKDSMCRCAGNCLLFNYSHISLTQLV